jgi:hypothetical protein
MAPTSALPIGATRTVNEMQPITLDPASAGSGLLNAIVALLSPPIHPEEAERYDEEVLDLPVSGFIAMSVPFHLSIFGPFLIRDLQKKKKNQYRCAQSEVDDPIAKSWNVCGEDRYHGVI